jgi:ABC-type antimicrobial peptide transport system permease subunit
VQEATLLACTGALIACILGITMVDGAAVRFTMGAFMLKVDSFGISVACGVAVLLGIVGAIPPALKAMRAPVAEAIKSI